jgi:uncharacterized DUF497 family protein
VLLPTCRQEIITVLSSDVRKPIRGNRHKECLLFPKPEKKVKRIDIPPPSWYRIYTMEFEFDAGKNIENKKKHGIDFEEAQLLWDDPGLLEVPARTEDEPRYLIIGLIKGKHWSVVVTYRDSVIRIISARRSRREEVVLYES